jgi:hypothetical protein
MRKHRIITSNYAVYQKLKELMHEGETRVSKGGNGVSLRKILKHVNNGSVKIQVIDDGRGLIIRKLNDFRFNLYLKR